MPELPEVETVRAGLERHVVGRTVATRPGAEPARGAPRPHRARPGSRPLMVGRTFTRAERRGKYLWLALDDDEALLAHLGMSGQLLVGEPDRPLSSARPRPLHVHRRRPRPALHRPAHLRPPDAVRRWDTLTPDQELPQAHGGRAPRPLSSAGRALVAAEADRAHRP